MALALGAAACGSSSSDDVSAPADAPASADAGAETASSVLDISAPAADGTTINLSDYAGQDLMLWFWAPW